MHVQIIKGHTKDAVAMKAHAQRWASDLRPGAEGFLGSTFGVADDGTFYILVRFADEQAAEKNAARPEQDAFFAEGSKLMEGQPTFRESDDVTTLFGGGSDTAGFVQVIEGRVLDRAKIEALEPEVEGPLRAARPDLMGALRVWFDGGVFVEVAYFTSEADARKGEATPEFGGPQGEYGALFADMAFTDLRDPVLTS